MTKQLLCFPGITYMRSSGLVTKHWFYFSVDFVEIMIYLKNICFNHTHECLATALFCVVFFFIVTPFLFACMAGDGL